MRSLSLTWWTPSGPGCWVASGRWCRSAGVWAGAHTVCLWTARRDSSPETRPSHNLTRSDTAHTGLTSAHSLLYTRQGEASLFIFFILFYLYLTRKSYWDLKSLLQERPGQGSSHTVKQLHITTIFKHILSTKTITSFQYHSLYDAFKFTNRHIYLVLGLFANFSMPRVHNMKMQFSPVLYKLEVC